MSESSPKARSSRSSSSSSINPDMMRSIILDPDEKPDLEDIEGDDFVEVSEADTLVDSSSSLPNQPAKDGNKKRRKGTPSSQGSEKLGSSGVQGKDVHAGKRTKTGDSKRASPASSWDKLSDSAADAKRAASKWASVFSSSGGESNASDDYDHIEENEADDPGGNQRQARIDKAKARQRRRDELRRSAPAPEQIKCPCLTGGKDGWKECEFSAHRELGRLTNKP